MPLSLTPSSSRNAARFVGREVDQIALDLRADDDRLAGQVRADVVADLHDVADSSSAVGQVDSSTLHAKIVGLSDSRKSARAKRAFLRRQSTVSAGLPASSAASIFASTASSAAAALSPRLTSLPTLLAALLHGVEVGEHQLGVDHFDVAHGSTVPTRGGRRRSSKQRTTWTMASTSRTWVRNLLPSPSPWLAPLTRPGDVDELDRRGDDDAGLGDALQLGQPRVGHRHDADVRIDGAERIVRRLGFAGPGDGVEQRGLADVRQTDDSSSEHGYNPRS